MDNIEYLYSSAENSNSADLTPVDPSLPSDLDHSEVGTIFYGINNKHLDDFYDYPESEWLTTIVLDIQNYYDLGGLVGFWYYGTNETVCYMEMESALNDKVYFKISNPY